MVHGSIKNWLFTGFHSYTKYTLTYLSIILKGSIVIAGIIALGGNSQTAEEIGVQVSDQEKKTDQCYRDLENLEKEVALEKDRVTTKLLTLSSRENRYATSITEMLRKQRDFYHKALSMADAQLDVMEKTLNMTPYRLVR